MVFTQVVIVFCSNGIYSHYDIRCMCMISCIGYAKRKPTGMHLTIRQNVRRFWRTIQQTSDLPQPHSESTVSDDRVDWSKTFPGIKQPNEAYSLVLNKNIAYEQTKKPQRQRNKKERRQPPTTEGPTETAMQYENIPPPPTQDECLYKEAILPRDTAQTLSGPAIRS